MGRNKMSDIFLNDIMGMVETVTTIPTKAPKKIGQQILIYIDNLSTPTVKRLYIYSNSARLWSYINLT